MQNIKVLDAITGEGAIFKSSDNLLFFKLIIQGVAGSNIRAFYIEKEQGINGFFFKIKCSNWNGAIVKLYAKSSHVDDDYSWTGDYFFEDRLEIFYYT